jgi:hypothetical protein
MQALGSSMEIHLIGWDILIKHPRCYIACAVVLTLAIRLAMSLHNAWEYWYSKRTKYFGAKRISYFEAWKRFFWESTRTIFIVPIFG